MFIYNVHAPSKTFALAAKEKEDAAGLIDRIVTKAHLSTDDANAVREKKDGAGVVYEFDGDRWALEDDDDLAIVNARFQTEGEHTHTPSITLHIVLSGHSNAGHAVNGGASHHKSASAQLQARTEKHKSKTSHGSASESPARRTTGDYTASTSLGIPSTQKGSARSVRSALSTRSRRSRWGDDDAEPLGDVKRREFEEFHANNGVRTVVGKVGDVNDVRMLLKNGYRHVYISRTFAARHGLISHKQGPGTGGYSGLQILGNVSITVGSRTGVHTAMLSEEPHFDVILGRAWIEKMNIKVDPLDQTLLTYMDSGEVIPCDLVVLRDSKGEIITVT